MFFCWGRTQKSNSEPPENEHMPLKKDGWKMHVPCKNGSFSGEKSFIFGRGFRFDFLDMSLEDLSHFTQEGPDDFL